MNLRCRGARDLKSLASDKLCVNMISHSKFQLQKFFLYFELMQQRCQKFEKCSKWQALRKHYFALRISTSKFFLYFELTLQGCQKFEKCSKRQVLRAVEKSSGSSSPLSAPVLVDYLNCCWYWCQYLYRLYYILILISWLQYLRRGTKTPNFPSYSGF